MKHRPCSVAAQYGELRIKRSQILYFGRKNIPCSLSHLRCSENAYDSVARFHEVDQRLIGSARDRLVGGGYADAPQLSIMR
jgi:hypothetical protein